MHFSFVLSYSILDTALYLLIVGELGLTLLGKIDILSKILLLPLYRRRLIMTPWLKIR